MKTSVDVTRNATRRHYETHPFVQGGADRIDRWDVRLRRIVPGGHSDSKRVLDVGCGSGEVSASLKRRFGAVTAIDLTRVAATRTAAIDGVSASVADALHLPFSDATFDEVVSMGVLHHTPDCRRGFLECARVTRPGGHLTVLLYRRRTPYHLAYLLTRPLRAAVDAESLERLPSWFYAAGRPLLRVATGLSYNDNEIRAIVADQFFSPQATFHGPGEIRDWAASAGLHLVSHRRIVGYSDIYRFASDEAAAN